MVARRPEDVRDPIDLSSNDNPHIWERIVIGEPRKPRPERHRRRAQQRGKGEERHE
jgi:hypothetical protein